MTNGFEDHISFALETVKVNDGDADTVLHDKTNLD